ncbi:Ankyrin repeat-containing protein [Tenacibaculum sp. MAR_2009_124]|uniref:ankyrin repeat domain-containing protein n=1 Tax=Tenacibaculum sp. MAR_2009_124 TaxID=1250059 RepID=UPI0008973164|nr:ankyrin repeat domain-containing protein [Tenacibaculum sp. MAR_2009_124]SEC01459.1 Ankyrin repeat-containing protein [Tenacibaculum sp. MAR_2009_124]
MSLFKIIRENKYDKFINEFSEKDLTLTDSQKYNLLMVSIFEGAKEISFFLIDKGIDLNYQDKKGQTVLHHLAIYYDKHILIKILGNDIDINISDNYGNQALWSAVFNDKGFGKRTEMVKLLIDYGADPNHINNVNKSPIEISQIAGYKEVYKIMSESIS